jgi:hypothetical protein
MYIVFAISIMFFLGFLFTPVAYLGEGAIVLLPLFTDILPEQDIWQWQNTAAFVMTYFISVLLLIYFEFREKKPGIIVSLVVNAVSVLIIFTIVWMTKISLSNDNTIAYGYGWIFWLSGMILFLITLIKKPAAN